MELNQYVQRADKAEKEIEELTKTIKTLLAEKPKIADQEVPEELEKLRVENNKLKYRLGILQRATADIQSKKTSKPKVVFDPTKNMLSVLNNLEDIFKEAVNEAFPDLPDAPCPITPSSKFGDYQFNGAMAIAGLLKGQGIKMPPRDVANKILEKVPKNDLIEKLDVAGPGFVNILISKSFVSGQITDILKHGVRAPLLAHDPKEQKVRILKSL